MKILQNSTKTTSLYTKFDQQFTDHNPKHKLAKTQEKKVMISQTNIQARSQTSIHT